MEVKEIDELELYKLRRNRYNQACLICGNTIRGIKSNRDLTRTKFGDWKSAGNTKITIKNLELGMEIEGEICNECKNKSIKELIVCANMKILERKLKEAAKNESKNKKND